MIMAGRFILIMVTVMTFCSCLDFDYYNKDIYQYLRTPLMLSLNVSQGVLIPDFNPHNTQYSVFLETNINEIDISTSLESDILEYYFYSDEYPMGCRNDINTVSLKYGDNLLKIKIVGENKRQTEYTINVNRFSPIYDGDVIINDRSDLIVLSEKKVINGDLTIDSDVIENIEGLDGICSIKGDLNIVNNKVLQNTSGLNNLNNVQGDLNILNNQALDVIGGFDSLNAISGNVNISYNCKLESIDLNDMNKQLIGSVTICSNERLMTINSFDKFYGNMENLKISDNQNLFLIGNFSNILQINNLEVVNNYHLSRIEMKLLSQITGNIKITNNYNLYSLHFPCLKRIEGPIAITDNRNLENSIILDLCDQVSYSGELFNDNNKQ